MSALNVDDSNVSQTSEPFSRRRSYLVPRSSSFGCFISSWSWFRQYRELFCILVGLFVITVVVSIVTSAIFLHESNARNRSPEQLVNFSRSFQSELKKISTNTNQTLALQNSYLSQRIDTLKDNVKPQISATVDEESRKAKIWITRKIEDSFNQLTQMVDEKDGKTQTKILQLNKSIEHKSENAHQKSKLEIEQNISQLQNNITERLEYHLKKFNTTIINNEEEQIKTNSKIEDSVNQLNQSVDERNAKMEYKILQLNKSLEFKTEEANRNSKLDIEQNINQLQNNITEQLESRFRQMNETMIAKEEQQIKADILTLEKMSKFEENVRNLTTDLSKDRMENFRSSNETLSTISSLNTTVTWILNFIKYLTGNTQTDVLPTTGNSSNLLISKIKEVFNKEVVEKVDPRIEDKMRNSPLTQKLDQLSTEVKNISKQMATKDSRAFLTLAGYEKVGNFGYFVRSLGQMTFENAQSYCKTIQGRLAEFGSAKGDSSKFDSVVTFAKSKNLNIWWIGLKVSEGQTDNRSRDRRKWIWLTTSLSAGDTFSRWGDNEPNNHAGGESCGEVNTDRFNDVSCSALRDFVCEANNF